VGGGRVSYRHKKHTHIHKMLTSFNFFLGILHKVQKEQFIFRFYTFLCPSVYYPLPCYQRLNSSKGFNFLFAYSLRFERKIRLSLILI